MTVLQSRGVGSIVTSFTKAGAFPACRGIIFRFFGTRMSALMYIAAVFGAAGLYLTLPHGWSWPRFGGVLAFVALAIGFAYPFQLALDSEAVTPDTFFYIFTAISAAASVRVITHPRPIYSALYFVIVVLSTCGLLVLLDAEFMAMALAIIYGGAILVTYMFVIMLATMPQTAAQADDAPFYERNAREPAMATIMGFVLIMLLGHVFFSDIDNGGPLLIQPDVAAAEAAQKQAVLDLGGRFEIDSDYQRSKIENALRWTDAEGVAVSLRGEGVIGSDEWVHGIDLETNQIEVSSGETYEASFGTAKRTVTVDDALLGSFIYNTDRVGLNVFESHTLGIELAGVVLLVSMVGAIVIGRKKLPDTD